MGHLEELLGINEGNDILSSCPKAHNNHTTKCLSPGTLAPVNFLH